MNATHSPFVIGAYAPAKTNRSVTITSSMPVRRVATKVALILAGFAAMGYLIAVSFARMG